MLRITHSFIARFRTGGVQDLPGRYSGRESFREVFRGLDDSIAIQQLAAARWQAALDGVADAKVSARMEADLAWFEATASRYRLMAATCDYVLATEGTTERDAARIRMEREIDFLENAAVTRATISPLDQSTFLAYHRTLLGSR